MGGFFWDAYDNLGKVILFNLLWFLISLPALLMVYFGLTVKMPYLMMAGMLIPGIGWLGASLAGLFFVTQKMVDQKDITLKDFFLGIKSWGIQSALYTLFWVLVFFLAGLNIRFYLNLGPQVKWMGAVLAGLFFWLSLVALFALQYFYPLITRQNPPVKKLFIRTLLLVIDNLGITILSGMMTFSLLTLSLITGIGLFFFSFSLTTLFTQNLLFETLAKYDEMERLKKFREEKKLHPTQPKEKPTSWHQILPELNNSDSVNPDPDQPPKLKWRHEGRGWKDILRPWDM